MEVKKYLGVTATISFFLLIYYFSITAFFDRQSGIISPVSQQEQTQVTSTPSGESQEKVKSTESSALSPVSLTEQSPVVKEAVTPPSEFVEEPLTTSTPPASGYQQQQVAIDLGVFTVDIIAADLNTTWVIVDTASDADCHNDCPVLPLGNYVVRNGAFAGVNGSYFCPASYESCSNKKNAFDTLLMNKDKKYFNSENNIFSTVPAVIFSGNLARFVTQSLAWGRDTSVDAVIANQPLLVLDRQLLFTGDDDYKRGVKSNRSFVGTTGNTVYIGVVHNATVANSAQVVYNLGINSALNLDSGGSTALWYGNYKVGPGRDIPNAILFISK